jgi:RNA polymerase sigma factor (sigma-70 family)
MQATGTVRRRSRTHGTTDPPRESLAALEDSDLVRHPDRAAAFAELYERYAPRVIGYCHSRITSSADAEEVAAQALARAWSGFPPDQRSTFRAWLFTITHHTIVDFYRSTSRAPSFADARLLLAIEASDPDPETASLNAETRSDLIAAIQELPPDQQHAIALRIAGFRGPEIAEVMGRSPQAVKMLQFRAITTLRTRFADAMPGGEEIPR